MRILDASSPMRDDSRKILGNCLEMFKGILILLLGISLTGCIPGPSRSYKKEFVTTYAELTLLYEKEKMVNKQSDSLYQITVKDFFAKKGLKQEEFKLQVEELSKNEEVWKFFIQDVSAIMDSLKNKR